MSLRSQLKGENALTLRAIRTDNVVECSHLVHRLPIDSLSERSTSVGVVLLETDEFGRELYLSTQSFNVLPENGLMPPLRKDDSAGLLSACQRFCALYMKRCCDAPRA